MSTGGKHLFFDLDDTLWDIRANSAVVLHALFAEHALGQKLGTDINTFIDTYQRINLEFWSLYYKKAISREHLRHQRFHHTFKAFGYDNYDDSALITGHYMQRAPQGKALRQDCLEVLDYLKPKHRLHILTNGFREAQHIKISSSGLQGYFDQVIISEEYQLLKPDEKIFRLAETLAGAEPHNCVMIGDSYESDIAGALNAGWEAIHLTGTEEATGHGKAISRLSELMRFF